MKVDFEEVWVKATKQWTDEDGKKRQKTKKFSQTINPFNRDADGNVKSREQIMREIMDRRAKWLSETEAED